MPSPLKLEKPRKLCVPLSVGKTWRPEPGIIYQEKMDGRFSLREIADGRWQIAGEQMRSGEFWAFDLLTFDGEDVRNLPLSERLHLLCKFFELRTPNFHLLPTHSDGAALLAAVLARGGEGVVRKRCLDAPWGTVMEACKRLATFYCVVTGFKAGTQSVEIALLQEQAEITEKIHSGLPHSAPSATSCSTPRGAVALRGGKADRIRVGSIIKIEGLGLTANGLIREPRPCHDTPTSWLVQY